MRSTVPGAFATPATAALLITATPAQAAPSIERVPIEFEFSDDFLSAECGIEVSTISGFRIVREFGAGAGNRQSVVTIDVKGVASSEFGSFRLMDVGADRVRRRPTARPR